jgi:hypothetical protein
MLADATGGVDWYFNGLLGVAFPALAEARWIAPPRPGHEDPEGGVHDSEDPEWRLVVEDTLNPVLNETARVRRVARLLAQP